MSFDNLTVYGDKVSFGDTNLSMYSQNNQSVVFNMTGFQADSTEPVTGDIIYMGDSDTNLSFEVQNLPAPEKSYNVSLGGQVKEFSNGTISTSLNLSENSSLKVSEKSIDDEVTDPDEGDGGGSTGGGGSGGGSTGGGGAALSPPDDEDNTSTDNRVADVQFSRESYSESVEVGTEKNIDLNLSNTGNMTAIGGLTGENLSFQNLPKQISIEPEDEIRVNLTYSPVDDVIYSGNLVYEYQDGKASLPVEIDAYSPEPEINSSISKGDQGLNVTMDIPEEVDSGRVKTTIYDRNGGEVYTATNKIGSRSDKIKEEIDKRIDPGKYKVVTEIFSENISYTNTSETVNIGDRDRSILPVVAVILMISVLLGWIYWEKRFKKEKINQEINSGLEIVNKNSSLPEKSIQDVFEDKLDERSGEMDKHIEESLNKSKEIFNYMKSMDNIPDEAGQIEEEIREDLEGENFKQVNQELERLAKVTGFKSSEE